MENVNRWYFTKDQLANTPSKKCDIDNAKELSYRQMAAKFIQDMGQRLQLSQLCINTAIVYMHRFYVFHSFSEVHRNNLSISALFLAAKVEEQPRKLEHVIKVAHVCLHKMVKDGPPTLDVRSEAYAEKAQEVVAHENVLLQTLGFVLAIEHPHTYVVKVCQLVKASKDLAQSSYLMATTSLHMTTMCVQYKPTVVACVCIHLACKWSNYLIEPCSEGREWYYYVDRTVTLDLLEKLTQEFIAILEASPNPFKRRLEKDASAGHSNSKSLENTAKDIKEAHSSSLEKRNGINVKKEAASPGPSSQAHVFDYSPESPPSESVPQSPTYHHKKLEHNGPEFGRRPPEARKSVSRKPHHEVRKEHQLPPLPPEPVVKAEPRSPPPRTEPEIRVKPEPDVRIKPEPDMRMPKSPNMKMRPEPDLMRPRMEPAARVKSPNVDRKMRTEIDFRPKVDLAVRVKSPNGRMKEPDVRSLPPLPNVQDLMREPDVRINPEPDVRIKSEPEKEAQYSDARIRAELRIRPEPGIKIRPEPGVRIKPPEPEVKVKTEPEIMDFKPGWPLTTLSSDKRNGLSPIVDPPGSNPVDVFDFGPRDFTPAVVPPETTKPVAVVRALEHNPPTTSHSSSKKSDSHSSKHERREKHKKHSSKDKHNHSDQPPLEGIKVKIRKDIISLKTKDPPSVTVTPPKPESPKRLLKIKIPKPPMTPPEPPSTPTSIKLVIMKDKSGSGSYSTSSHRNDSSSRKRSHSSSKEHKNSTPKSNHSSSSSKSHHKTDSNYERPSKVPRHESSHNDKTTFQKAQHYKPLAPPPLPPGFPNSTYNYKLNSGPLLQPPLPPPQAPPPPPPPE
ncbi:hypothetical protein JTE90_012511 [Oedothorax gibbosus]|uniref:Cyclin-like domain-containing protein n=1 Tax=Oedothorax gibbosus TaxID=931172 RepID=A0AAV6V0R8_9ARAC|nr:hypothetical protein JTE90_012511 [Oedothorax gibbosus]